MKNLKGGRCVISLAFILLGVFIVLFAASVIFNQQQPGVPQNGSVKPPSTATPLSGVTAAAPGDLGVTIDVPDDPTATPIPTMTVGSTATPGPVGLGTASFPLTLTAQHADDQTRVAGRLSSIDATQTEISRQSQIIFATLTAAAPKK